jgi:hypothetical protein
VASAVGARGNAMRSAEGAAMSTQTVPNECECNGIVARENPMTSEMLAGTQPPKNVGVATR